MSRSVLDASAILALILSEPGADKVEMHLAESLVSSVNLAEVYGKLEDKGLLSRKTISDFARLNIEVADFDEVQALQAGRLRKDTKHLGLSLGDRCCLALAISRDAVAITADRNWKNVTACPIEVIR